jgi:hypothetical protein
LIKKWDKQEYKVSGTQLQKSTENQAKNSNLPLDKIDNLDTKSKTFTEYENYF